MCLSVVSNHSLSPSRRDSSTRNSNPDASMSRGFLWLGPTRKAIKQLQPGESITIPLRAKFMRSGVFDVNRFRFIVNKKTFAFPSQVRLCHILHGLAAHYDLFLATQYIYIYICNSPHQHLLSYQLSFSSLYDPNNTCFCLFHPF